MVGEEVGVDEGGAAEERGVCVSLEDIGVCRVWFLGGMFCSGSRSL